MANTERCERPPAGWWCSRESGHEGPCAALPKGKTYPPLTMALRIDELEQQLAGAVEENGKLRTALAAYRSALRSGEPFRLWLREVGDAASNYRGQ